MEEASRRKDKDPPSPRPEPEPEREREPIQGSEEQGDSPHPLRPRQLPPATQPFPGHVTQGNLPPPVQHWSALQPFPGQWNQGDLPPPLQQQWIAPQPFPGHATQGNLPPPVEHWRALQPFPGQGNQGDLQQRWVPPAPQPSAWQVTQRAFPYTLQQGWVPPAPQPFPWQVTQGNLTPPLRPRWAPPAQQPLPGQGYQWDPSQQRWLPLARQPFNWLGTQGDLPPTPDPQPLPVQGTQEDLPPPLRQEPQEREFDDKEGNLPPTLRPELETILVDEEQGDLPAPVRPEVPPELETILVDEEQGDLPAPLRPEVPPELETILVDEEQGKGNTTIQEEEKPRNSTPSPEPITGEEHGNMPPLPSKAFTLAPYYRDPDPEAPAYFLSMAEFYLEAARLLPIAQMPILAGFLSVGGLLLGLNDPVTNIIVNAMYIMAKFGPSDVLPHGTDPERHAADTASYVRIARKSRAALVVFMTFYFRHLTRDKAKDYLSATRHDLVLAIGLVEFHRRGLEVHPDRPSDQLDGLYDDLLPDCARTKTALRYAASAAMLLQDPDDIVQLVASRFHSHLLRPIIKDLQEGKQLTVSRVNDIIKLLQHPWSPPPPLPAPTPGTFRDADGNVTIIVSIGQDLFSTTTITRDRDTAFNNRQGNEEGDLVTTTTISRHPSGHGDHDDNVFLETEHLTIDPEKKIRFHSFMCATTAAQQLRPDMNSLMMCLLDTIHGFYIEAIIKLPSEYQPRLLHAVRAAGYCFGIMHHPVHNIIVNSIWYSLHHPPPKDETVQIQNTRSMTRIASCSLRALIALVEASPSINRKGQEAVLYLNSCGCRFHIEDGEESPQLSVAAHATKNPQPSDLVEFMELLLPLRARLSNLLTDQHALSNDDLERICNLIDQTCKAPVPMTSNLCQPASSDPDSWVQAYVREKLEELLFNYGLKDPLGPQYKLGIICGAASKICYSYHRDITCYHANFLASTGDTPVSNPRCVLFFAEFWNEADDDFERSKMPPICCPATHRTETSISYHCRCFICESAAVRIVHPIDVNYFMGHEVSTDSLCAVAEHEAALGGMKMESEIFLS